MSLLDLLPWWAKALIVAAVVAACAWAVHTYNESLREDGRAEIRAEWDKAVIKGQAILDKQAAERGRKQKEADDAWARKYADLSAGVAGLRSSEQRLQQRVAGLIAAARRPAEAGGHAAGVGAGDKGADPLDLLAELFSRIDGAAGQLAEYADKLRLAGQTCERYYDAVTAGQ